MLSLTLLDLYEATLSVAITALIGAVAGWLSARWHWHRRIKPALAGLGAIR